MPKTVDDWIRETGETPKLGLGDWIEKNPEVVKDILDGITKGYSWRQMNRYLTDIGGPKVHPDSLRRALTE